MDRSYIIVMSIYWHINASCERVVLSLIFAKTRKISRSPTPQASVNTRHLVIYARNGLKFIFE